MNMSVTVVGLPYPTVQGNPPLTATVVGQPQAISATTVMPVDRSSPSSVSVSRIAGGAIAKYQVVVESTNDKVVPANIQNSDENYLGVATSNASVDFPLDIRIFGELYDPSFNWSVGDVFCGEGAILTQSNPQGTLKRIAYAVSAHTLIIDIRGSEINPSKVLSGTGAPSDLLGNVGDLYLDTQQSDLYGPKTSTWGSPLHLKGADGASGTTQSFIYYPPTTTDTWTINHNFGYFPSVIVEDSTGTQVWADVDFPDINTVEISFAYPTGGRAILT